MLGFVDNEVYVRHADQGGIRAPGEGDDLKPLLFGPGHVVEHDVGLPALGHRQHQGGLQVAYHAFPLLPKEHVIVKMHAVEHRKPADGQPVHHIGRHVLRKAHAHGEDLPVPVGVEQFAKAGHALGVHIRHGGRVLMARPLVDAPDLDGEVIKELPVAREPQPLAEFHDKRRGYEVFIGDLLDAYVPFAPLDVIHNAGDDLLFILGYEVCQQIIISVPHLRSARPPSRLPISPDFLPRKTYLYYTIYVAGLHLSIHFPRQPFSALANARRKAPFKGAGRLQSPGSSRPCAMGGTVHLY